MQIVDTLIKTKMNPKDFQANYRMIKVRDCGEDRSFESTATTEIFHEDYDPQTELFTIGIALHYPRRTSGIRMTFAKVAGSTSASYTFVMQSNLTLEANIVTNPFIPITGIYNGLFTLGRTGVHPSRVHEPRLPRSGIARHRENRMGAGA
jgi:hypothetical protein